jgi:aerobic carbon-monoxide dehydrogenase large subunit
MRARWQAARAAPDAGIRHAGTVINPLLAEGQVLGGIMQGLGACLFEEAI